MSALAPPLVPPPGGAITVEPPDPPSGVEAIPVTDRVRKYGMYFLLWIFGVTVAASLVAVFWAPAPIDISNVTNAEQRALVVELAGKQIGPFGRILQLLQVLLPAETALLGSVLGFYYGTKAKTEPAG